MANKDIILIIERKGCSTANIMGTVFGASYQSGYRRAIADIIKLIQQEGVFSSFEAEQAKANAIICALKARCKALEAQNKALKGELSTLNRKLIRAGMKKPKGTGLFQKG